MESCPSDNAIQQLRQGELDTSALGLALEHVNSCTHCRGRLGETIQKQEEMLRQLRSMERGREATGESDTRSVAGSPMPSGRIPKTIGAYELLETLGEGGLGTVYLAQQHEPVRRRVALKVIKAGMDTREVVARFEAERQALAVMDHPHVAKVFDGGATPEGRPYFVMELVAGEAITVYCDRNRLTTEERLELFVGVCEAVQHAHQKGIIHRDLKPSNVLITVKEGKPVPKVIDFGIAKAINQRLTEQTIFTERGLLIGTPEYMSPEQAEMGATDVDTRTDVYSLGVLLYELLTGTLPFDSKTLRRAGYGEIQRIIRDVEPPKPSTRLSSLKDEISGGRFDKRNADADVPDKPSERIAAPASRPKKEDDTSLVAVAARRRCDPKTLVKAIRGDLDWIVMKCLEKDRTRRYETANAITLEIRRSLENEPVLAGPPSASYRIRKFIRRKRGAVLAASLVAAALVLGLVGTVWQARRANDRAHAAELAEAEARRQARAAEDRRKETQQVAEFQAKLFSNVDVPGMGVRMQAYLLEEVDAAMVKGSLDAAERQAKKIQLEKLLAGANLTNVALKQLEREIFGPALKAVGEFENQPIVQACLLQRLADSLRWVGLLDLATAPQEKALAIRRSMLGDENLDTVESADSMGALLKDKGKLADAEPHSREALQENLDTLESIMTTGELLKEQGKLTEAEPYYREALEKMRRVLGDEDPDTLESIKNMGVLLKEQGKLAEAEPYYREALDKMRRALGDEDPDTLESIYNMGVLLKAQGKLGEAEPYYREALEKARRVLGDKHPKTLISIGNMGLLLRDQDRLAEAEPYYREALDMALRRMSHILQLPAAKLSKAEPYQRHELERMGRDYGDDHPVTLILIGNMGHYLQAQGKLAEAEPYFREALEKSRRVFGDDHPNTLTWLTNLGNLLQAQGKLLEAEAYYREVLEKMRVVLGHKHHFTQYPAIGLAELLGKLSRFTESEALLLDVTGHCENAEAVRRIHWPMVVKSFVELYDSWHAAEPSKGYDKKAAEWRTKLKGWQATTQPAATQPASSGE